jgi:hypothetical protein
VIIGFETAKDDVGNGQRRTGLTYLRSTIDVCFPEPPQQGDDLTLARGRRALPEVNTLVGGGIPLGRFVNFVHHGLVSVRITPEGI